MLSSVLPIEQRAHVELGGTLLRRGSGTLELRHEVVDERDDIVKYAYRAGQGRPSRGYLAPFSMVVFKHGLYVVGRHLDDPKEGLAIQSGPSARFAAERFTEAEALRMHPFAVPMDFRLDDELQSAFDLHSGDPAVTFRVVIEFSKERAPYAKAREWHRQQTLEPQPDGSVLLSFPCSNLAPVVSWVLEWGPHARAVEPRELVKAVSPS